MSATTPTNVATAIPEIWAADALRRVSVDGYWSKFAGKPGSGMPIVQKSELLDKPGDLIHIQVTGPLSGAGQTGDTFTLEGNEENLSTSEILCSPLAYGHAVRSHRRANKKNILDLEAEARMRLEEWARDKMDEVRFEKFAAAALPAPLASETYTPNVYVAGGGTGVNDVAGTDLLTVDIIKEIKLKLRMQQAKPLMVDGKPMWVLVTHPYTTFDLKNDTKYESWAREAENRGKDNPLFTGALLVIDGVIIHDHESVPVVTNAGAVDVSKGIAFGREFAVEALDENVKTSDKTFDYDRQFGRSIEFAFQPRRSLEDYSVQVYAAAVSPF